MKKVFCLLVIFILGINIIVAQQIALDKIQRDYHDRDYHIGKVKTLEIYEYYMNFNGFRSSFWLNPDDKSICKYDSLGNIIKKMEYYLYDDVFENYCTYNYIFSDNQKEKYMLCKNGREEKYIYKYDDFGNLLEEQNHYYWNPVVDSVYIYNQYDADGKITKETSFCFCKTIDSLFYISTFEYMYQYDSLGRQIELLKKYKKEFVTLYDSLKKQEKEISLDTNSLKTDKITFIYNFRNTIDTILIYYSEFDMNIQINYEYDKNGNIVKELNFYKSQRQRHFKYNRKGYLIKEHQYEERQKRARMKYVFKNDNQGNWIKLKEKSNKRHGGKWKDIIKRKIEYYE